MSDTPARLLQLLSLLQTPREWPGSELADRLRVSPRTVRRDIERLRDLGYPVQATMGSAGGYRLVAGTAMPPLLLDDEEAVAITVGLRTAAGQAVEGIDEAAARALAKLEQVLPARLRHRVATLGAATVPLPPPGREASVDPGQLAVLAAAAANRERASFAYEARDGTTSRRMTEPHRLVAAGRRWYLVAWDTGREAWRSFRVDRITGAQPTGVRTEPREPPGGDAAAYVRDTLYGSAPVYTAVATVHLPASQVEGRLGDGPGDVEPIGEGSCRVRSHTDTLEWLAFRLAMLGCAFEVHEPPELVAYLRALGTRVTAATGG